MPKISFRKFIARLKLDNMDEWDTVVCTDGAPSCRHGPVGLGKTAINTAILVSLHPHATIAGNTVIKSDIEQYMNLLKRKEKFVPIAVDEAENWFYKRTAMYGAQIDRILEFMSNRKECKYHLLALPSIWDTDLYFRKKRIQWRLRVERRGEVSLFVRNSPAKWNEERDIWGEFVGTFYDVPMPPNWIWREYHRCVASYRPAVWSGTGKNAKLVTLAVRAEDVWEPEHPLSPTGYINPAQPESGGR